MEPTKPSSTKRFQVTLAGVVIVLTMILVGCSLSGCSGGGGGGGETASATTPSPTPTDPNGEGLPLNVRQYVEEKHPNSAKERAALFQYAKVMEVAIADANDKAKSVQHGQEADKAITCLAYTFENSDDQGRGERLAVKSVILNTDERNKAYFTYDAQLGGEVFHGTPYDQRASACTINPATLPN